MNAADQQLALLWSIWVHGSDIIDEEDLVLFHCEVCNPEGQGYPGLCPNCGPHIELAGLIGAPKN